MIKLKDILVKNPGYIKKGNQWLADKYGYTYEEVREVKYIISHLGLVEAKSNYNSLINNVENTNESNSDYNEFLDEAGIDKDKVKSTKYWQTQKGEVRYSVVTKEDKEVLPSLEEVKQALGAVVSPINYKSSYIVSNKVLVVYTTDKHVGAKTEVDSLYENNYNEKVFADRMSKVVAEIYDSYNRYGRFDKIIIMDLGDGLDGYNNLTTRGGHTLPQNMSNKEAFNTYIDVHKRFYRAIAELDMANFVSCYHLTDNNHGGEFDYFAVKCLGEYMNLAFPKVDFNICEKFLTIVEEDYFTLILTHGKDEKDMRNGLPLNLDARTESYLLDYAISNKLDLNNLHVIKGDLHQSNSYMSKHFRYKNVPSIYGASKWVMTNFGNTKSGCSFDIFEEDKLLSSWDLWFKE